MLSELNVFQANRHRSRADFELARYLGDLRVVVYIYSAEGLQKRLGHEELSRKCVRFDFFNVCALGGFFVPLQYSGVHMHILRKVSHMQHVMR